MITLQDLFEQGNPLPFKLSPIPAAGVQRLQLLQRKIFYKTGAVRRPVDFVIMDDDNLAVFCELDVKLNEISVHFGSDIKCRKCIFGRVTGCAAMSDGIQACQLPHGHFCYYIRFVYAQRFKLVNVQNSIFGIKIVLFRFTIRSDDL